MHFFREGLQTARQFVPCILAAAVGVGASLASALGIVHHDDRDAVRQFDVVAENHFMVLENGIKEYTNRLRAVRALFDSSSQPVTRDEFLTFTRPLMRDNGALTTLGWIPRVTNAERAQHEREGVEQGLSNYHIKAIDPAGKMAISPEREEYFPIFYATVPLASPLYGVDGASDPPTLARLERARDQDQLEFSQAILVIGDGVQRGFIFSLPVYRHGAPHDTVEDRRRNLVGFVHGAIMTDKMIDSIIVANKTPAGLLDSFFYEPAAGNGAMPNYVHASRLRKMPLRPQPLAAVMSGTHWSRDLTVDDQPLLTMVVRPMPGGQLIPRHARAWIVFAFGIVLTAVIVVYIRMSRRHASRMMRVNQTVSDLAHRDPLTSLANRRVFVERLNDAFAASRRGARAFAVLYFDLDHFKDVNDTLGHGIGDQLLQQVASRVLSRTRETDVVARFGGDEFAILQSDVDDVTAAGTLASAIQHVIAESYMIGGSEVHVTASIGISRYTPEVTGPDAMMIQADLALYRAKEDGRDCFRFHTDDLDRQVQERVVVADELRGAIARNELEIYYQPQVELRSGRIVGLEALLRWNHPKRGRVPPSVFIPIAERSGQIARLGQWVLDQGCRQMRAWQDRGIAPVLLEINLSALHFKASADLDLEVAASLEKWAIAPDAIEIEMTESVFMDITQQHNDRFERLRRLGVKIAIDDFGTGYSSLSYLANYPINRIKIAQELVFGVVSDKRSATVVRAAVQMAHELGMDVIAEGVETEGQAKLLLAAGCETAQGFYFSEPVGAEQAAELLKKGKIKPARPLQLVANTAA